MSIRALLGLGLLVITGGCSELALSSTQEDQGPPGPLDGVYVLAGHDSSDEDAGLESLTQGLFSPLRVRGDVIQYGELIVGEFRLINPKWKGNSVKGRAEWHEDVDDPGDMTEVKVELRKSGSTLRLTIDDEGDETSLVYRKQS